MPLMRGAGTVLLVSGARRRIASERGGGAQADAVYEERKNRDN
jgi:hypothetical protein